jgi:hypothetical protein
MQTMQTNGGIKGMSHAICQIPGEPDGTYSVVRLLNVPMTATATATATANTKVSPCTDTPLHLCDPNKLITQHRLGDHGLPYRTIDPKLYDQCEIDWYGTGVLPPPMHMCFIYARKCYLCGDMQTSGNNIHGECTEKFNQGYRFCTDCVPYFRKALYKTLAPIWRFRLESERADRRHSPIWVHRTRRDEFGNADRTNSGRPFRYTRWFVSSWIARKSINKHDPNADPFEEDLICVEEWVNDKECKADPMSKLVSVMDVFFANRGSLTDPDYDPNVDDPLNQIRHMPLDEKREIMRMESEPFEYRLNE